MVFQLVLGTIVAAFVIRSVVRATNGQKIAWRGIVFTIAALRLSYDMSPGTKWLGPVEWWIDVVSFFGIYGLAIVAWFWPASDRQKAAGAPPDPG
jgi:hypothetical protein